MILAQTSAFLTRAPQKTFRPWRAWPIFHTGKNSFAIVPQANSEFPRVLLDKRINKQTDK